MSGWAVTLDHVWAINVFTQDGEHVDSADDLDTAVSVLYGDLSDHDGRPRIIQIPLDRDDLVEALDYYVRINADCFDIPLDTFERTLA